MRSGLYTSLLTLLGAAGLALTQGPACAEPPQGRATVPGGPVYGSVFDADSTAPASPPVKVAGPVPMDNDLTRGPSCLGPGGHGDGACGVQDNRFYARAEFILWRITNGNIPPLTLNNVPVGVEPILTTQTVITNGVTTSVVNTQTNLPVVFQLNPALGSGVADFGDIPGGRLTFGYWLDPQHCFGVEASFFALDRQDFDFSAATGQTGPHEFPTGLSNNTTTVTVAGTSSAQTTTTVPIILLGNATANTLGTTSTEMWGAEVNAICEGCQFGGMRWNWLGGLRYLNLNEDVTAVETASLVPVFEPITPGSPPGTMLNTTPIPPFNAVFFSHVTTHDYFVGPQVGVDYDWCLCHGVALQGFAKVAVGDMHEAFSLVGFNVTSLTGTASPGGLFVAPNDDQAHRKRDRIAALPEFNIDLVYSVTPRFRVFAGYDLLYISSIARSGTSLTTVTTTGSAQLGPTTAPLTLTTPVFNPVGQDMWVQGFNAGLEFRF